MLYQFDQEDVAKVEPFAVRIDQKETSGFAVIQELGASASRNGHFDGLATTRSCGLHLSGRPTLGSLVPLRQDVIAEGQN
jgi:hypothetical protein